VRNTVPLTIVGNLTERPELRFTPAGAAVCKFSVAVNKRVYDKVSGQWKDAEASFYRCQAWRDLAEHIAESLDKGHRVIVTGELSQRSWPDKDDPAKMHYAWEVTADEVGPSLTWATASIKKMARTGREDTPPDDAWATGARTRPAGVGAGDFDGPGF